MTNTKKKWKIRRVDVERGLILCASAMVVALALHQNTQKTTPYETTSLSTAQVTTATQPAVETQAAVVYYQDGEGYLVPVTRQLEKTDGIAKATLNMMVSSAENDLAAARLGLKTTVPEGTTFDLDIRDGKARVDLSREALSCMSAEQETLMVHSVAQTLCEFDTVEEVSFLFDGQQRSRLTFGTDVSGVFTGSQVNLESVETMSSVGANSVQLYFPSSSGRMLVPVTRTVYSDADVATAMLELAKGPKKDSGLEAPLPQGCGVRSVKMKNGVVTVDFSKEFMDAAKGDNGVQTVRAILFTALQFPGVKKVEITVEGAPYTPPENTAATFLNQAQEIETYYPGVIEID
ncbi:MAG: GerMN domain-containing protein [Clostridia bacterium]|nr:GerMN domain-containing protein [Clostridia bacterium]